MIMYKEGNDIQWVHPDDSIKQLDEYINDPNCIVINHEMPIIPDDKYIYKFVFDDETQKILVLQGDPIPISDRDAIDEIGIRLSKTSDVSYDIDNRTIAISDDALLLMELLMSVDEKLTQLLQPKQT